MPKKILMSLSILAATNFSVAAPDTGLIDMGSKSGTAAHIACPAGSELPVIRTKAELDRIQAVIGTTTDFWLNGHLDPVCVSAHNCQATDVIWEDDGPAFDVSLYPSNGWLKKNIDGSQSCVQVWAYGGSHGNYLDDTSCSSTGRTICVKKGCESPLTVSNAGSSWSGGDPIVINTEVQ